MDPSTPSNALPLGSTRDYQGPYIHQLPQEILILIFHLCLGWQTPGKDLTRLRLVCHAWKATADSAPSLWTPVNARDGLQHVRTAITKTKESPIGLIRYSNDPVSLDDFLIAVGGKIAYWRSVELWFNVRPESSGTLRTSECDSLEKLDVSWMGEGSLQTTPLCLFDGSPPPATLRVLSLYRVPVNLGTMRLSNLSELGLNDVPHLAMEDILLVLENCPSLVNLRLQNLEWLRVSDPVSEVPIRLGSLTTCAFSLPIPVTRFLLSAMHTPSLRRMDIHCDLDGSTPASSLFSPPITTFAPTLRGLISPAKYIDIEFALDGHSIVFGGLWITLETSNADEYQCLRDMLDSLMSYPGANEAGLNAHLSLDAVEPDLENLLLFNCQPMVEELMICGLLWDDLSPTAVFAGLGTRLHNGPEGWLFPELEVIKYYLDDEFYDSFEMALERRYCEVRTNEETSTTTRRYPRSLKEIHFHWEKAKDSGLEVKADFLKKIRALAGNPKIFWRGVLLDLDSMSP